ncbi:MULTISPECIES: GNAT family N-acetyltransferase [Psychrilyobacter]|uniref:GNAT family N-acetyltransferase n=1 Tax=Psychrilyobacter piezotolerans TaxID=2293438 RepID=A0ABX9KHP3_9FUSO|nr:MULTISPECIES: GNAT family N-acetyltransferase [Psychrilyobacter]MCS5420930.1 GNAT family N-acetyltransferase [Psychrilyobacter sp. S5]NDI77663.1 GNAT family N-acetyltransferase [Psychrilyobacter piezotolerans]RDE62671.1 GNAT family N-acetyltransferase [Psychrilyobacter sp. S5]REI41601.1 GNAT family N-acetyltransferase [Psychrilyobacter piezotolerans]
MGIYFKEEYAKIYELNGDGKVEKFQYEGGDGRVEYLFLKRDIELSEGRYYDITTPYGYGGPLFFPESSEKLTKLISNFREEFESYCKKNKIISEFIRFHPILRNHRFMERYVKTINAGATVYIDLSSEEEILLNMKRTCRKSIKRSMEKGFKAEMDNSNQAWDKFIDLYYMTMNKNNAENYYYFPREYFENMRALLRERALIFKTTYKDKVVSAILVLAGEDGIHGHLHATDPEYYRESPNNILIYTVALWGLKNGYKTFHLGGGYGGAEDTLFKFKSSFNKNGALEFYIGEKIHDHKVYNNLTKLHEKKRPEKKGENLEFFPLYRR